MTASPSTGATGATSTKGVDNASPASTHPHPLGPLTGQEIVQGADLIRAAWPEGVEFQFKVITLAEPAKAELAPYLVADRAGKPTPAIDRRAFVVYYFRHTVSQPFCFSPTFPFRLFLLANRELACSTTCMRPSST